MVSDAAYAAILMAALLVGVTAAVGIGIITDQRPSRKVMAMAAAMSTIGAAALVYASFIALLPLLAGSNWVWVLVIPGGVGGGFFYALAITYLQDLLGKRAGAGASPLALQRIASDGLCAGIFALGTWISGYALVGLLGGLGMVAALAALIWLDRYKPL